MFKSIPQCIVWLTFSVNSGHIMHCGNVLNMPHWNNQSVHVLCLLFQVMCFGAFSLVSMVVAVVSIQLLRLGLVNHMSDDGMPCFLLPQSPNTVTPTRSTLKTKKPSMCLSINACLKWLQIEATSWMCLILEYLNSVSRIQLWLCSSVKKPIRSMTE